MTWRPSLGAWPDQQGTHFGVWAPTADNVAVVIEGSGISGTHALKKNTDGTFSALVPGVRAGDRIVVDGGVLLKDR